MKRKTLTLTLILTLSVTLACSLGSLTGEDTEPNTPQPVSEKVCGDGVCDGPENIQNCPGDCESAIDSGAGDSDISSEETVGESSESVRAKSEYGILYHIVEHTVASNKMDGTECYMFNFLKFLDGGYVQPDGSDNQILELKDFPTSHVTSKKYTDFYYISSPNNPVMESYGFSMFNWDVENQTLWNSDFADQTPVEVVGSTGGEFPGGVTTSPENQYLLYVLTQQTSGEEGPAGGFIQGMMNPFSSDSKLTIMATNGGGKTPVLSRNYNRQLFTSFADFSADGKAFYTIAREGESFKFVKISLASGEVAGFTTVFPGFDWGSVNWNKFFPRKDDFSYASFTISPDEKRLIAYKNVFTSNLDNPCFSEANHTLWVFNLETNKLERFENRQGYVSDVDWKGDSSAFALAAIGNSGCYPDYLDSKIEILDKDGQNSFTLVEEPKSKITNLGWSPDGEIIVYDVYGTDFVGRLKQVNVQNQTVTEIINTQNLGYETSKTQPVTLHFVDWVLK